MIVASALHVAALFAFALLELLRRANGVQDSRWFLKSVLAPLLLVAFVGAGMMMSIRK